MKQSSGPSKQQHKKKMDPQDSSDHDRDYNDDQYTEFASYHRNAPQDPSEAQAIEVVSLASDSYSHSHSNDSDEDPILVLTRQHDEAMAKLSSLQEELQQAQQQVLLYKNNEAARKQDLQTVMQHYEELQVEYECHEQELVELQQQLDQVQSSNHRPELKTRTEKTKKASFEPNRQYAL